MKLIKKWSWLLLLGVLTFPLSLQAAQVGEAMPSFTLTTLDGKLMDSKDIIGKKSVLFVFWATWCPNCKAEIPQINEMVAEFEPQGMLFLGVNVGVNDSEKKVRRYAEKYQIHYPLYFDQKSQLTREFGVTGTPTVIIVDKNGIVRYRDITPPADLLPHFAELNR